jgi:glutaconate CoA-transferase subunit A
MARFLALSAAVEEVVRDGDKVAFEGFTHLIPYAAGHEAIRQRRRDLTLVRMTPDLLYDQMIGMGAARRMVFSWGGNPGVGSLHRFREAYEQGWPQPLEIEEHSHAAMANAFEAGAAGLPFAAFRGYRGAELQRVNPTIKSVTCPYTGEVLATVPAMRLDAAVIHAQKADRAGNVLLEGIVGVQKEAVLAAKRSLVTVEEVVDDLGQRSFNACVLPHWTITAIAVVPGGAHPSYTQSYYKRDNAFYEAWDEISRNRDSFKAWMDGNVLQKGPEAFAVHARKGGHGRAA